MMTGGWTKPIENSIEGLVHGMMHFDGVEFDLRLSTDDELFLFHDNHLSNAQIESIGGSKWTEDRSSEDLRELGINSFQELLENQDFTREWTERAKIACVELKMPHPKSKHVGSVNPRKREKHARKMARIADSMIQDIGPERNNIVLMSFKRRFRHVCSRSNVSWPVAQLQPAIPEIGGKRMKRILTLPSFMWLSLAFHLKHQKLVGAPILPCALEYLDGMTRHLTLGRTMGLSGYTGRRLNRLRKGYPVFVWPTQFRVESAISDLGLTGMTDQTSPELVTLPNGGARWTRWGTQPLDPERTSLLQNAESGNHVALIQEAARETTPWPELTDIERRNFLSNWRKKWMWDRDIDELVMDSSPTTMPWEVSRLIGHRGSGNDTL